MHIERLFFLRSFQPGHRWNDLRKTISVTVFDIDRQRPS